MTANQEPFRFCRRPCALMQAVTSVHATSPNGHPRGEDCHTGRSGSHPAAADRAQADELLKRRDDIWAADGFTKTLILHWNGARWRHVPSPGAGGAFLNDVAAISANNAWAVRAGGRGTLILHWNGTAWHRVRSPAIRGGAGLIGISGPRHATSGQSAPVVP